MDFLEAKEIQVRLVVAVLAVVATATYLATKKSKGLSQLSHNVYKFRFALPTPTSMLGLPIGQHISCRGKDSQGEEVIKPYTSTTLDTDVAYFELVIK
ncbi:NADH-cytochrome b5 reductase 1, partial [Tanacetum coccineum]